MDSNQNNNISSSSNSTGTDHFFPTSTTSPHFFDPLGLPPTFLDSPTFPTSWPPPPPEPTNYPTTNAAATSSGPTTTTTTRPSKKRSRASRRAPTTVLTTDTSNFRAMVQEFTGIPAPPFATSSPTSAAAASLHFPRSLISPPPPFFFKPAAFLPTTKFPAPSSSSASEAPISFQSLLQSQVQLNSPQPVVASSSGSELSLPGVLGAETRLKHQRQHQQMDPTVAAAAAAVFRAEKASSEGRGDGLLESWVCSSD
ncbi:putative basic proline-rich protein-like [Iris pallida]|uniref:Basic proline-rich protein-like n=1 Tax=Iris pallida TaxID=29817 RepID=A0AAX6HKJ8_IRIPA|nr:putative basic proline-rich protein-like [Iris pallida]